MKNETEVGLTRSEPEHTIVERRRGKREREGKKKNEEEKGNKIR